jgi:minor extracellular serine protease Vpr
MNMKKISTITLIMFIGFSIGQLKLSNSTLSDFELINKVYQSKNSNSLNDIRRNFPINTINHVEYISLILKTDKHFSISTLDQKNVIVGTKINDILTLKVSLEYLNELLELQGIKYIEIASKIQPFLDQAIKDVRADSVHKGINLPQAYTGKNVYIGITDWGFDYTHPNFYDTLLNETRIEAAWDQYKQSGPAPEGFTYGTEYKTPTSLLAAQSDTSNIYNYAYHGSHVAGIAGGSGGGTPHRGVAFESKFLLATFLIDAGAVIDAYEWMYQKAVSDQKRLVINQSWGLHHMGTLDGNSLLSQAIDYYSNLGVVFVSSGGNNGDRNFHIKKTFENDTIQTRINFYTYDFETMWGQSISLWGEPNKPFSAKIQVLNVSNQIQSETPFYITSNNTTYLDSMLIIGIDTVFFNLSSNLSHPLTNVRK